LPIAAAALDRDSRIVAANNRFKRLCRLPDWPPVQLRLADAVAEQDRPAVEEALNGLAAIGDRERLASSCRVRILRASPPALWLELELARLEPGSVVPYVACLRALPRRRRIDGPSTRCPPPAGSGEVFTSSSVTQGPEQLPAFLLTLSHELRSPLDAIRGWAHLAECGVLPPAKMSRALGVIERNAASLSELIQRLFDVSRWKAGSLEIQRQRLDLSALVQVVLDSCRPAATRRHIVLSARHPPREIPVDGDPVWLEQVVRNLLDNAIKFSSTRGRVHVQTASDGGYAEIVVSDNGQGIVPELLPVVFEAFWHDDAIVRPQERGLGLGLALVRELVRLHEGDVRALSEGRGKGATFIVRLPLAATAPGA
jgi:signal transduction histidine kinase